MRRKKANFSEKKHKWYQILQSRMGSQFGIFGQFSIAFGQPEFAASGKASIDT